MDALTIKNMMDYQEKSKNEIANVGIEKLAAAPTSTLTQESTVQRQVTTLNPALSSVLECHYCPETLTVTSTQSLERSQTKSKSVQLLSSKQDLDFPPGMNKNLSAKPIVSIAPDRPPGINPKRPVIVVRTTEAHAENLVGSIENMIASFNSSQAAEVQPKPSGYNQTYFLSQNVPLQSAPAILTTLATATAPTLHAGMKRKAPSL